MDATIGRRQFLSSAGAVTTAAIAGCAGEDPADEDGMDGETDVDGSDGSDGSDSEKVLQLMEIQQQTLDPIGISGRGSGGVNWQTHEQLFSYIDGRQPVEGLLAAEYDVSEDYTTYTISLKEDVTFHDGSELTADDVVYSLRRLAESENNRGNDDIIVGGTLTVSHETDEDDNVVPASLGVEAVDESTVEIELESPFHATLEMLADITMSIVPEGVVGDIEGYDGEYDYDDWSRNYIHGTGPFRLEEWDQGNEIVLERFDDFHAGAANIGGIRWQIVEDANARYNRAMNRNADVFEIPRSQFDPGLLEIEEELDGDRRTGTYGPVRDDATLNYGEVTLLQTTYLLFNTLEVEKPARQALAYITNQETVADTAYRGQVTAAYHLTPPAAYPDGAEAYHDHAESEYPYGYGESRLEEAREVMEDAGYTEDDMYETTFHYPSDENASEWADIASLLRDQAESAHINLDVQEAPSTTLTNRAIEGSLEIFGTFNELEWAEADSTLQYARPSEYTWTRWGQSEEMSDAARQADEAWQTYTEHRTPGEENQSVRNDVYVTLEEMNWEDMTELPLVHNIRERYAYDWVENLEMVGAQHSQQYDDLTLGDRS